MKDINSRNNIREGWIECIVSNSPKYALTLTFDANSPESKTRKALDRLINRLNRAIYRKRYKNGLSDLKGVAARERGKLLKKRTQGLMYCDHYHLILFEGDEYLPDREVFRRKLIKEIDFVNRNADSANIRTFDLQSYYNDGGNNLERYVTKIFDDWSLDDDYVADSIGPIERDEVGFGRDYFEGRL